MTLRVQYFAAAREAAGCPYEEVSCEAGATVADLVRILVARHPDLAPLAPEARFAVGTEFVGRDAALADGDAVAWIPPVSGG